MSLALLTLGLPDARPAQAQGGWSVTDADGNSLQPVGAGYPLTGTASGGATNTYPQDMTAAALVGPYNDPVFGWVDNSQWLQSASNGPHTYDPNPLGTPFLYHGGTTSAPSTSIALNATAHNYAFNNTYYGSFNPKAPPFFTNQYYPNPSDCEPVNGTVTGRADGTLWAYWNWVGPGPVPVDHLNILLTTNVSASSSVGGGGSGLSATATASDGDPFNETVTSGTGVPWVVGHHLLRVPVTGAAAAVSLNGNVSVSATNTVPYGAFGGYYYQNNYSGNNPTEAKSIGSVSATANIDGGNREVRIFSGIGTTSHKGVAGLPEDNKPDSNGTLTDDTVAPSVGSYDNLNPYGAAIGSWGANSGYKWSVNCSSSALNASPDRSTESGTVGPNGTIPAYVVTYYRQGDISSPILSSYHLAVRDGVDGAQGSADYRVNFHNEYEKRNQLTDSHVDGPWTQVSGYVISGPNGGNFPLPVTGTVSVTVSIVPGGGVSSYLAQAYNVTDVGATYSSPTHNAPLPMPPSKYCWIVDEAYFEQITGTVDNYERSGFQSMIPWTINRAYHPGNPLIDYGEQLVSSDSPPPTN